MRSIFNNIRFSFPVQLFILHFRKYQLLLIFWVVLISTINSGFMKNYGADALFHVPEYLGNTNALAAMIVGASLGVFFMSWNITTFILHSNRFRFLAATSKPFLKYCINNSLLPLFFLVFYITRMVEFDLKNELLSGVDIFLLVLGLLSGIFLQLIFSFAFFFGADRTILRVTNTVKFKTSDTETPDVKNEMYDGVIVQVGYYFSTRLKLRKTRNILHYSDEFLDLIFKRHHFAGVVGILLAFILLTTLGFLLDNKIFQFPAASSIILLFAVMIAVIGALNYFLQNWIVLFLIGLIFVLNILYTNEFIDPRNKAYGVNYSNKSERPEYSKESLQQICTPSAIAEDKANMLTILENWETKQQSKKPVLVFINVSGGGLRSAAFVMNALQQLDSISKGGLMRQTFLISGASGGMLSATYMRELYLQKQLGNRIDLTDSKYTNNITQDLLNPVFSSMIDRDIFAPAQKFSVGPYRYVKDRGYAFEEKLNANVEGIFNKQMKDYIEDERKAKIPLMIFNSVITRDGRKLIMGSQPLRFLMKPASQANDSLASPDAVDFSSFFSKQDPQSLRLLSALRMNATFPYVLPNVWLPSTPVIDVMDAGLRDNYGQETTLRFIETFQDWIQKNTDGVVIVQMRDRMNDNWQNPLETGSIEDILIKPATMLQHNWYKVEDFYQTDQLSYLQKGFSVPVNKVTFMYVPEKKDKGATLNFHLTALEKKDVISSFKTPENQKEVQLYLQLTKKK